MSADMRQALAERRGLIEHKLCAHRYGTRQRRTMGCVSRQATRRRQGLRGVDAAGDDGGRVPGSLRPPPIDVSAPGGSERRLTLPEPRQPSTAPEHSRTPPPGLAAAAHKLRPDEAPAYNPRASVLVKRQQQGAHSNVSSHTLKACECASVVTTANVLNELIILANTFNANDSPGFTTLSCL